MGKLIQRKALTEAQYKRANMVMSVILTLSYVMYFIVELLNVSKHGFGLGVTLRCGVYIAMTIALFITYKLFPTQKRCAIIFSITFLIAYAALLFGNGVVVMTMVFPVLIGFMIYFPSSQYHLSEASFAPSSYAFRHSSGKTVSWRSRFAFASNVPRWYRL